MKRPTEEYAQSRPRTTAAGRDLLLRLPEYYRENPGLLADVVGVAEELADATRRALDELGSAPFAAFGPWSTSAVTPTAWYAAILPPDWPPPRAVWHDARMDSTDRGDLVLALGVDGSVVSVWDEGDLEGLDGVLALRGELLPVGIALQVVALRRFSNRKPLAGSRYHGNVLWQREAR